MSVLTCIDKLIKLKKLSKRTENEIIDFLTNDQQLDLNSASLQQQIAGVTLLAQKKANARAQAVKQTVVTAKAEADMRSHPKGLDAGWAAKLAHDGAGKAPYDNVWTRYISLRNQGGARLGRWIDEIGAKWLGFGEDVAAQEDALLIARGGRPVGNNPASQGFADAARDTSEWYRQQAVEAGMPIAKRADWGSPQVHKYKTIAKVTRDEYKDFTRPLLDPQRMYKPDGSRMSAADIEFHLDSNYDAAETNGGSRIDPGTQGHRSVANQWLDARIFAFTPEGFVKYNNRFGEPNAIKLYMDHFASLSNDIAMVQVLGPNPEFTKRYLTDLIRKETGKEVGFTNRAMWNVVSGVTNEGNDTPLARWGQGFRNVISGGLLPSAAISSLTGDIATTAQVAHLRGLSTLRILDHYKTLMTQGKAGRAFAARLLVSDEMFLNELHGASRMGEVTLNGITGKVTDLLFRASTLTPQTHALKAATGVEFLQMLGANVGRAFDHLPPEVRAMFTEYGFTPSHWEVLRKAPLISGTGHFSMVKALDVANLPALTDAELSALALKRDGVNETFRRITDIIATEVNNFAVPTPDLKTRAVMTGGIPADSFAAQGWRTVMLFKSFPLMYMLGPLNRALHQPTWGGVAKQVGSLGAMLTVAGAIRNQLVDITKGNDPENMYTGKFWGKAFLAGGGATLYGDYIGAGLQGQNRYAHGALVTLLGPGASWAEDTGKLLLGTGFGFIRGDDIDYDSRAGKAVNMMRTYSPKTFYTRLALDRLIWDQLQSAVDPHAGRGWARTQRRMMKDDEKESWWRSGDLSPERAPDLGAAVP